MQTFQKFRIPHAKQFLNVKNVTPLASCDAQNKNTDIHDIKNEIDAHEMTCDTI